MLRLLGSPRSMCDGLSRRDWLQVGGWGAAGLTLDRLLGQSARAAAPGADGFGRAKNCIVLFLYGSPSQLETFDVKPDAPVEVRGEFGTIPSAIPGLGVGELLPKTAGILDRCALVRSVNHDQPIHGVAYAMTGVSIIDPGMELNPRDDRHHPYFGSCVEFLDRRVGRPTNAALNNIALPFPFSSKRSDQPFRAGPYPAFLGGAYAPVWTEFVGKGTVNVRKERAAGEFWFDGPEPYVGCSPDTTFRLAAVDQQQHVSIDRLDRRRRLLDQLDDVRRELDRSAPAASLSRQQELAWSVLGSRDIRDALDLSLEPQANRDRYGRTLFGQSCVAARRLVEAGSRVVSVFWDEYGLAGDAWDTHDKHFVRMKDQLCPGLDHALHGLINDLDERSMLDETLVVLISEHGRTPKINSAVGGGRDHWARAYSVLFAGGGTPRGAVIGATDAIASDVTERPVSPKSLLATMYHLLGVDPHSELTDATGRPTPLVPEEAEVIRELIA
ncbi:MAG: DUF1501 domain-containing protein [Planctomycetaceae bacterium]